jgi:hypothetical protein
MFANLSTVPAENITTTVNSAGGVTTHYLVPTERLPLVQLFSSLAPIEGLLKQWVDAGYSRNDQPAVTTSTALSLTTGTGIESSTLANDAPVGALTEPVEAPAQAGQGLAEATTEESVQADQRVVDTAEEHATASEVKAAPGEPAQAGEGLVDAAKESASATGGLVEAAAKEPAPDTAAEAVSDRVPDLTDGKKESPSTKAGTTRSSSRSKPGDEIRAATGAIQRWFSRTNASTSKIETPASDTSTPTGSEATSSTSSSADSGSSTP